MTYRQFNGLFSSSFANVINVLSGPMSFGAIFRSLSGTSYADASVASQNYGNVQFGWPEDEERLIDSDDSYKPLENQLILDQSGQEDAIASTYAACFGYRYDAGGKSLDPTDPNSKMQLDITGSASLGTLLSNGDIVRDANGDVVPDQGLCSPQNLGVHNTRFGDLVFRWRLAMSYDTTVNQLTNLQAVANQ